MHQRLLPSLVLAAALAGCAVPGGVPGGNLPGFAKIAYDFAAQHAALLSGGKVTLPPFDASQLQTDKLPFKFENGRITLDAGLQATVVRLAQGGGAQLFANGGWYAIPGLTAAPKASYDLLGLGRMSSISSTCANSPYPQACKPMTSFLYLEDLDLYNLKQAGGDATPFSFTLMMADPAGGTEWKVVGSDGADDMVLVDGGGVTLDGGAGNDKLANQDDGLVAFFGGDGNDDIDGGAGIDWIDGGAGDDDLSGGDGNDYLEGGAGNDKEAGGGGNDFCDGGDGTDTIDSGAGDDTLYGGGGDDVFEDGAGADDVYEGEYEDANNDGLDDDASDDAFEGPDMDGGVAVVDEDEDNDGTPDASDDDIDGDGQANAADGDDDGDGVADDADGDDLGDGDADGDADEETPAEGVDRSGFL